MEWKSDNLLKVSGITARKGIFTGLDGEETCFSPEFLRSLFDGFDQTIPLFFTHYDSTPIGFVHKIGYNEEDDTITYDGVVFNKSIADKILNEGYDKLSPDIRINSSDASNPRSGVLTGAAFTRSPAIPGTDVEKNYIHFSAPAESEQIGLESKKSVVEEKPSEIIVKDGRYVLVNSGENKMENVNKSSPAEAAEIELAKKELEERISQDREKLSELSNELEQNRNKATELENQYLEYKEKYESMVAKDVAKEEEQLKEIGFDNPEEYAKDFEIDKRLALLREMRSQLISNSKLNKPLATDKSPESKTPSQAEDKISRAKKIGISEEYLKFLK